METAKRKHKLFDRPFLGGLVALVIALIFVSNLSFIPALGLEVIRGLYPEAAIPAELVSNVNYVGFILASLVCLLILRQWFRKDGFQGCFNRPGFRNREVWMFVLGGLLLDVVDTTAHAVSTGTVLMMPSIATVLISLQAGVNEETIYRAVPVSIMMKNNPSRKRMWAAALITAAVFGLVHMGNVGAGAALTGAIVQSVNALCMGLFLAAIYLRSGNILLTMVFHTLHDVIALTDPAQVTGVFTTASFGASDLVVFAAVAAAYAAAGIYMLRKSKWEEIQATWANIWAE